jgi:hypothetical protein
MRPSGSTSILTSHFAFPFTVTTKTRVLGVLVVMESTRRLRKPAKPAFSAAAAGAGTRARKARSKWTGISADGMGRCASAPTSQRACLPAGVLGKLTDGVPSDGRTKAAEGVPAVAVPVPTPTVPTPTAQALTSANAVNQPPAGRRLA